MVRGRVGIRPQPVTPLRATATYPALPEALQSFPTPSPSGTGFSYAKGITPTELMAATVAASP